MGDSGSFRIPGLRNVAHTAPYMHDGQVAALEKAVRHESAGLSAQDAGELVSFLRSLTDGEP
jgi:cytochrome c peroxidase